MQSYFNQRTLTIVSKHQKERAIASILESNLGVTIKVLDAFDTDRFGSFNGKTNRIKDPLETVKAKCNEGLDWFGGEMGVASEGSFGPHPFIPFALANEEWLYFTDRKMDLEIVERSISTETNFHQASLNNLSDLFIFAKKIGFPEHGIVLKNNIKNATLYFEDFLDYDSLLTGFFQLKRLKGPIIAETDMRAHRNPTRMKHIQTLAKQLINRIKNTCPECEFPGFRLQQIINGLPCCDCNHPTRKALKHVYQCKRCQFTQSHKFPNGKTADPSVCDICNP